MHLQLVVDEGADAHVDGRRRGDPEVQPRRRQGFEIGGIGEERKNGVTRLRHVDALFENEGLHGVLLG